MTQPVLLLVGGRSTEHDASLHGYRRVLREIAGDPRRFAVHSVIYIDRLGRIRRSAEPPWPRDEAGLNAGTQLEPAEVIAVLRTEGIFVFSLLHGNEGEDGAWQGVAEIFDIRGNFGPVLASALGMDKRMQGIVAVGVDPSIRLPETWSVRRENCEEAIEVALAGLAGRASVVKPNSMGASLLATLIRNPDHCSLELAVAAIFPYDPLALVQEYISGVEYTCGVIREKGEVICLPVIQAKTQGGFLGHREKHRPGGAEPLLHLVDTPPTTLIKAISRRLFEETDCFAMARYDYIEQDGETFFLEANTLPGLMDGSAFPRMLEASGRTILDLIEASIFDFDGRTGRTKLLPYTIEHE